jgi:hypothetical protein
MLDSTFYTSKKNKAQNRTAYCYCSYIISTNQELNPGLFNSKTALDHHRTPKGKHVALVGQAIAVSK